MIISDRILKIWKKSKNLKNDDDGWWLMINDHGWSMIIDDHGWSMMIGFLIEIFNDFNWKFNDFNGKFNEI